MSELVYRDQAHAGDVAHVRDLIASSGFFSQHELTLALELLEERLHKGAASGYQFLFAERAGQVVAYTCFGPIPATLHSYDLYWIAVRNDLRGGGIGKKLLLKTESAIALQDGQRIYIETSSRPQYAPTRAFYLRTGYRETAVLQDFYAPGDSKIIFSKSLETTLDLPQLTAA